MKKAAVFSKDSRHFFKKSRSLLRAEFELDHLCRFLRTRLEFTLHRCSFCFRGEYRMPADNVRSLHLAIGADGYLHFDDASKV